LTLQKTSFNPNQKTYDIFQHTVHLN